jgi:hypothetical protein
VKHAIAGALRIEVEAYSRDNVARAWTRQLEGPHRKIVAEPWRLRASTAISFALMARRSARSSRYHSDS